MELQARCVGVVTGGNRGIGLCVVEILASVPGVVVVLACRSHDDALRAMDDIAARRPEACMVPRALDITSSTSVQAFRVWLDQSFPGGIDFLVNNAGFAYQGESAHVPFLKQAEDTLAVNYFGTLQFIRAIAPILRASARMVNVASTAGIGALAGLSDTLRERILGAATEAEVTSFIGDFLGDVRSGNHQARGWPSNSYGMSKLGLLALTRALSQAAPVGPVVCCLCPGWCITDMSQDIAAKNDNSLARTAMEGATDVAFLALPAACGGDSRDRSLHGKFVRPLQGIFGNARSMWSAHEVFSEANSGVPMPAPAKPRSSL